MLDMAAEPNIDFGSTEYWNELVDLDLKAAETVLGAGKLFLVGLMCCHAVEKTLNGWFVSDRPASALPATPDLVGLAKAIGVYGLLPTEKQQLLPALEPFKVAARSSDEREALSALLTQKRCGRLLAETETFVTWVRDTEQQ
jgi:hypothetical protein